MVKISIQKIHREIRDFGSFCFGLILLLIIQGLYTYHPRSVKTISTSFYNAKMRLEIKAGLFFQRFSSAPRAKMRRKIEFNAKFLEFSEKSEKTVRWPDPGLTQGGGPYHQI